MQKLGSRAKLRMYFLEHIGEVLESETLRNVAGTSEWARRVRELRNEEGYQILTHNDRSELKPGQYLLERSLSDIWNAMVTEDKPARAAIDESLIEIQREFRRKMREFGFLDESDTPVRPYVVREMDWVTERIEEAGQ